MAGDNFKRVTAGDELEIPAPTYNAILDAVSRDQMRAVADAKNGDRDARVPPRNAGLIRVKNTASVDCARFGIMGVIGTVIDPATNLSEFQSKPILQGDSPAIPSDVGKFVVAVEPIAQGAIGWAVISGVTPALLEVSSTTDLWVTPIAGNMTKLQSTNISENGAQIIYKATSSTGEQWGLVRLSVRQTLVRGDHKWLQEDDTTSPPWRTINHINRGEPDAMVQLAGSMSANSWTGTVDGVASPNKGFYLDVMTDVNKIPWTTYNCYAFEVWKVQLRFDERGHAISGGAVSKSVLKLDT